MIKTKNNDNRSNEKDTLARNVGKFDESKRLPLVYVELTPPIDIDSCSAVADDLSISRTQEVWNKYDEGSSDYLKKETNDDDSRGANVGLSIRHEKTHMHQHDKSFITSKLKRNSKRTTGSETAGIVLLNDLDA